MFSLPVYTDFQKYFLLFYISRLNSIFRHQLTSFLYIFTRTGA